MHTNRYIINQSYVGTECVFEMAMCLECREKMQKNLSEKSRVAMFDFMHDHVNMDARMAALDSSSSTDAYIAECIACNQSRESARGYTLGAMFVDNILAKGAFPMLMCSDCEEALAETISDETRQIWDRFIGDHFPGPPSEIKFPTTKPILL